MLSFKNFLKEQILLEYLTDAQRKVYSKIKMTDAARSNTDHFFGKDNDEVKEDLIDYDHGKSEVHREIEHHLGQEFDHQSYTKGMVKDKHGRDVKLGRLIKDDSLRNKFANDSVRAGTKSSHGHYVTVVRGTEVAGQTNPESDPAHPGGHSWRNLSCKNITSGVHRRFLKSEITHGSSLVRVHDHNGQEIYRATLHPHYNKEGHTGYAVDSEYGVIHPSFTQHAKQVADRLSGELKGNPVFNKDKKVYNDSGRTTMIHPRATSEHLDALVKSGSPAEKYAVARHPNISSDSLNKLVNNKSEKIRAAVAENPNLNSDHLHKLISDEDPKIAIAALKHQKSSPEHIETALKHPHPMVSAAVVNSNASDEHISKAINNIQASDFRFAKITIGESPRVKGKNLEKLLNDKDGYAVENIIRKNSNITPEHIDKLSKSDDEDVLRGALKHKFATDQQVEDAFKRNPNAAKDGIIASRKAKPHQLEHYIKNSEQDDWLLRGKIAENKNLSKDQIDRLSNDSQSHVRLALLKNPSATGDHIHHVITKGGAMGYDFEHAASHENVKAETLHHIINHDGWFPEAKKIARQKLKQMQPAKKKVLPKPEQHITFH
jgi:hypothetical protein